MNFVVRSLAAAAVLGSLSGVCGRVLPAETLSENSALDAVGLQTISGGLHISPDDYKRSEKSLFVRGLVNPRSSNGNGGSSSGNGGSSGGNGGSSGGNGGSSGGNGGSSDGDDGSSGGDDGSSGDSASDPFGDSNEASSTDDGRDPFGDSNEVSSTDDDGNQDPQGVRGSPFIQILGGQGTEEGTGQGDQDQNVDDTENNRDELPEQRAAREDFERTLPQEEQARRREEDERIKEAERNRRPRSNDVELYTEQELQSMNPEVGNRDATRRQLAWENFEYQSTSDESEANTVPPDQDPFEYRVNQGQSRRQGMLSYDNPDRRGTPVTAPYGNSQDPGEDYANDPPNRINPFPTNRMYSFDFIRGSMPLTALVTAQRLRSLGFIPPEQATNRFEVRAVREATVRQRAEQWTYHRSSDRNIDEVNGAMLTINLEPEGTAVRQGGEPRGLNGMVLSFLFKNRDPYYQRAIQDGLAIGLTPEQAREAADRNVDSTRLPVYRQALHAWAAQREGDPLETVIQPSVTNPGTTAIIEQIFTRRQTLQEAAGNTQRINEISIRSSATDSMEKRDFDALLGTDNGSIYANLAKNYPRVWGTLEAITIYVWRANEAGNQALDRRYVMGVRFHLQGGRTGAGGQFGGGGGQS